MDGAAHLNYNSIERSRLLLHRHTPDHRIFIWGRSDQEEAQLIMQRNLKIFLSTCILPPGDCRRFNKTDDVSDPRLDYFFAAGFSLLRLLLSERIFVVCVCIFYGQQAAGSPSPTSTTTFSSSSKAAGYHYICIYIFIILLLYFLTTLWHMCARPPPYLWAPHSLECGLLTLYLFC